MEKPRPPFIPRQVILIVISLVYAIGAFLSAWKVTVHSQASTQAIEKILELYSMKNEAAQSLARYSKEHPILGGLFSSPIRNAFELPSKEESSSAIYSDVTRYLRTVRHESNIAAWWSWFFVSLSLLYVVTNIALERSFTARAVIFSLTCVSLLLFIVGVLAPAMVIWTAPSIPMSSGNLDFVVQHQVRGIAAIIWELLTGGHLIIGGFLLLFSIVTPLTKASLTFVATASRSKKLNLWIGTLLHSIGKWSMADVFVAGVILALYALKFQEATKSIPCLGLYYFIGYCLLSLSTTELLVHSGIVAGNERKPQHALGGGTIGAILAVMICLIAGSSVYTYQQYTENMKEKVSASDSPRKLNNADLVLPAHK